MLPVGHIFLVDRRVDPKLLTECEVACQALVHAEQAIRHPTKSLAHTEDQYEAEYRKKAPASDSRFIRYDLACALFGFGDLAFSEIAFRSARESEVMTLLFTLTLAGSVLACSHFVGINARCKKYAVAALLSAVALVVIAGIAWIRSKHMAFADHAVVAYSLSGTLRHPSDGSNEASPRSSSDEMPTLLAYFSFNLLLFIVMVVYSYSVHDQQLMEIFKWRKALRDAKAKFRSAHQRYSAAYANRKNQHAQHLSRALATAKNVRRLLEVYKTHNLRARRDGHEW